MDPSIIVLVVVIVAAVVIIGGRHLRTQRALHEPVDSDVCVACNGTRITTFAPDCHRCDACGFVWGDGLRAKAAADRSAKIAAMSPEERRRFAARELKEADARLRAAEVALEHAAKQLGLDLVAGGGFGDGDMYSRARNEGIVTASSEMGLAQKHIRNAAEATGWSIGAGNETIDFHAAVFGLDVFFESVVIDVVGHLQVEKLQTQAQGMRRAVARAIAALPDGTATVENTPRRTGKDADPRA